MADQLGNSARHPFDHADRGDERRVDSQIQPPPFTTPDGKIDTDRRQLIDRRAEWIREFSLEIPTDKV